MRIQDENQAGGARIAGIVSRETGRKVQEFYGLGRFFHCFRVEEAANNDPRHGKGLELRKMN